MTMTITNNLRKTLILQLQKSKETADYCVVRNNLPLLFLLLTSSRRSITHAVPSLKIRNTKHVHTRTHSVCLFAAILHTKDAERMKSHVQVTQKDHDITLHACAAALYTRYVSPNIKRSQAETDPLLFQPVFILLPITFPLCGRTETT